MGVRAKHPEASGPQTDPPGGRGPAPKPRQGHGGALCPQGFLLTPPGGRGQGGAFAPEPGWRAGGGAHSQREPVPHGVAAEQAPPVRAAVQGVVGDPGQRLPGAGGTRTLTSSARAGRVVTSPRRGQSLGRDQPRVPPPQRVSGPRGARAARPGRRQALALRGFWGALRKRLTLPRGPPRPRPSSRPCKGAGRR